MEQGPGKCSAVKGISGGIGVRSAIRELFAEDRNMILSVDAGVCKGLLVRTGAGKGST